MSSFDDYLSQPLFPAALPTTSSKPVHHQLTETDSALHHGAQLPHLPVDLFETFFNFDSEHPQHPTDASSVVVPHGGDAYDSLIPETPESFSTDLFDDHASETSEFLNFLADSGAPQTGSDESGFGVENGDLSQFLSLEAVGV